MIKLKDIHDLDSKLTSIIDSLRKANLSSDASINAPIDKQNLDRLKNATVNTLTNFKNAIIEFLSE